MIDPFITVDELKLFETCVLRGINHQTTKEDYPGSIALDELAPFVDEGLPLYVKRKSLKADSLANIIVTISYKGELTAFTFTNPGVV